MTAVAETAPLDLRSAIAQLRGDLEIIRVVMGRPLVIDRPWDVSDVHPRHVFYQAQTLHRKANRLAQELGGASLHRPPPAPLREIEPSDVLAVVLAAHEHIHLVKAVLQIDGVGLPPASEQAMRPANELGAIILASRQLSRLLDQQVKPEDVYRRLELAVGYAAGMIAQEGIAQAGMALPVFEAGKMPRDVFFEVLKCMRAATLFGAGHGVAVLQVDPGSGARSSNIVPADVYDVATTLLADLAYLSWQVDAQPLAPSIDPPSRIFPSHVFQIARLLDEQLSALVGKQ